MADSFLGGLGDFLGINKGVATQNAADKNKKLLSDLAATGTGYLTQAKDLTGSYLSDVNKGANLYLDALGANGADGTTRAQDAFTHSPGYQQGIDEATQALMRSAAARGDLGGGGLSVDLGKYIVGAANNDWGNWLTRLGGLQGQKAQATGMATGSLGDLTQFASDITGGKTAANNMAASGKEANQGWGMNLLSNIAGIGGAFMGYGGFGGGQSQPQQYSVPVGAGYGGMRPGYQF